ncbi:MAG: isocitrate/isopropylmalate family dehydrogenase [Ruminococcus callidus]
MSDEAFPDHRLHRYAAVRITGRNQAWYVRPIHGSAPDIAGQNKANPIATISPQP